MSKYSPLPTAHPQEVGVLVPSAQLAATSMGPGLLPDGNGDRRFRPLQLPLSPMRAERRTDSRYVGPTGHSEPILSAYARPNHYGAGRELEAGPPSSVSGHSPRWARSAHSCRAIRALRPHSRSFFLRSCGLWRPYTLGFHEQLHEEVVLPP